MNYDIDDFEKDVIELSYNTPVLVDFWAEWCVPCKTLGPVLEELAEENEGEWTLAKVDTDMHRGLAQEYGIRGIPNVKLFVDGELVDEFTGALPKQAVEQWLERALPSKYREKVKEAKSLVSRRKFDEARDLLEEVVSNEPENDQARVLLAQTYVFSDTDKAVDLVSDIGIGSEYSDMAEAVRTFGRLFERLENPDSLPESEVKETYLNAIKNLQSKNFEEALERFIEVMEKDRGYADDGSRKACIAIFKYLGEDNEVTQEYRKAFSRALYV